MSDKFFFKGRQSARQDHTNHGYDPKPTFKGGSKKYPLTLVVTSESRKQEVEAQVAEAELYADITIDNGDEAVEEISELNLVLSKGDTVKLKKTPARNDPCSCGSGKKFKKCCG